jgi:hypothetical protein
MRSERRLEVDMPTTRLTIMRGTAATRDRHTMNRKLTITAQGAAYPPASVQDARIRSPESQPATTKEQPE